MTTCSSCGVYIEFIKTIKGKSMPVDAEKLITVVTEKGEVVKGHIPHWVTCDKPEKFRKEAKRIRDNES